MKINCFFCFFKQAAVSVGNVGQLAADLIVSTLEMTSVGYIYDESILPVVGNNPYTAVSHSSCSLVTGCEGLN